MRGGRENVTHLLLSNPPRFNWLLYTGQKQYNLHEGRRNGHCKSGIIRGP